MLLRSLAAAAMLAATAAAAPADAPAHAPAQLQFMGTPRPVRSYDFVAAPSVQRITRDAVRLSFLAYNQTFELHLIPNHDLLYPNAVAEIHSGVPGEAPLVMPLSANHVFDGKVVRQDASGRAVEAGWARITFDHPNFDGSDVAFDGVIKADGALFHVRRIEHYRRAKRDVDIEVASPFSRNRENWGSQLMIFTDEPRANVERRWGSLSSCLATDPLHPLARRGASEVFAALDETSAAVGSCVLPDNTEAYTHYLDTLQDLNLRRLLPRAPAGCPGSIKVLAMGVAADCSYIKAYGSTSKALTQILTNWNAASKVYESTFNVRLAVVKVSLQQACTPTDTALTWNQDCSSAYTITNRLSDFSKWRGQVQGNDDIGLWHLMTKCSQSTSGSTQFVSGTGVSSIVPVEWKVVAHEIGHNFGAYHDCMSSTLMHPLDNAVLDQFSPASISTICQQFSTLGHCLKDPGSFVSISAGICGNGVKEGNEQCDCGLPSDCQKDPCCDGTTCKLKGAAKCDDLNDHCCSGCQIVANGTVCHSSTGACDRTITCDGLNATCPFNTAVEDGTSCTTLSGVSAQCASGICTSRDLQCKGTGAVNTVSACPAFASECSLYCQDASGTCYMLNGNFLDGTTCGYTGRCSQGKCVGGNPFGVVLQWIQAYPQYAIPIIVFGALILLSMLYSCCRCCCFNPYRKPRSTRQPPQPLPRAAVATQSAVPPAQQPSAPPPSYRAFGAQSGWVDPAAYNGTGQGAYAPPPSAGRQPAPPPPRQQPYIVGV
ncbi:hypothetical protein HK105_207503 [Polyrhizophydium stewartii]|uniref:Disintegrin domain-containing protein n=1 Tax=Polyrhizophydium stewartii TaxID=2732419 RepID=A0ABR4N0J3_9FUNG